MQYERTSNEDENGEIKPALKRIDMDELEKLKQDGWKIKTWQRSMAYQNELLEIV